jgi:hypothetical protein
MTEKAHKRRLSCKKRVDLILDLTLPSGRDRSGTVNYGESMTYAA